MYKNNSGLIAKTKQSNYKNGLCLTEKLVRTNPLLFIYKTVVQHYKKNIENEKNIDIYFDIKSFLWV
jgi:hypothetical protein